MNHNHQAPDAQALQEIRKWIIACIQDYAADKLSDYSCVAKDTEKVLLFNYFYVDDIGYRAQITLFSKTIPVGVLCVLMDENDEIIDVELVHIFKDTHLGSSLPEFLMVFKKGYENLPVVTSDAALATSEYIKGFV